MFERKTRLFFHGWEVSGMGKDLKVSGGGQLLSETQLIGV